MPIDFVCPKCRADLETPEGTAGAVTVCPACGVALIVPNLNASANAPGSAGATLAPTASAATSRATHDPASHERERTGGDLSDSSGGSSSQDAPAARSPA
ncbi:MAG TPA: hypothetical protein VGE52_10975, partial [Pirellulales bacterium]